MFTMKFHAKERKMDLVRRRRWHRKMVQDDPSAPAVFHIDVGDGDDVRIKLYFHLTSLPLFRDDLHLISHFCVTTQTCVSLMNFQADCKYLASILHCTVISKNVNIR